MIEWQYGNAFRYLLRIRKWNYKVKGKNLEHWSLFGFESSEDHAEIFPLIVRTDNLPLRVQTSENFWKWKSPFSSFLNYGFVFVTMKMDTLIWGIVPLLIASSFSIVGYSHFSCSVPLFQLWYLRGVSSIHTTITFLQSGLIIRKFSSCVMFTFIYTEL